MKETTSREKVLKSIRDALLHRNENPFQLARINADMYNVEEPDLDVSFAQSFVAAGGTFVYCVDETDMVKKLVSFINEKGWSGVFSFDKEVKDIIETLRYPICDDSDKLQNMSIGITFCDALIARLGTIVVTTLTSNGRRMIAHPDVHIVIAYASQVVSDIQDATDYLNDRYGDALPSFVSFITGPSRTADIEKTLVMGAHGPRDLVVMFIDDSDGGEI